MRTPLSILAFLLILLTAPARGAGDDDESAAGSTPPGEMPLVLRIDRDLITGITGRAFQRDTPICRMQDGNPVRGTASTAGSVDVVFQDGSERVVFLVTARGITTYCLTTERGPVEATVRGRAPFLVQQRVFLNSFHFEAEPPCIQVGNCSAITRIDTPGGLIGLVVRVIVARRVPEAKVEADKRIRQGVCEGVQRGFDEQLARSLHQLNQTVPLEATVQTLFPNAQGWMVRVRITDGHILIGFGPPGSRFPPLPTERLRVEAPIELWIRGPINPQRLLDLRQRWRQAQLELDRVLAPDRLSEPGAIPDVRPVMVGEWVVIPVGQDVVDEIRRRRQQGR